MPQPEPLPPDELLEVRRLKAQETFELSKQALELEERKIELAKKRIELEQHQLEIIQRQNRYRILFWVRVISYALKGVAATALLGVGIYLTIMENNLGAFLIGTGAAGVGIEAGKLLPGSKEEDTTGDGK